jgi:hypothetical protein
VTLKSGAQTENSVREFPFNAADAMTLIGGRTPVGAKAPAPKKRVAPKKKPQYSERLRTSTLAESA